MHMIIDCGHGSKKFGVNNYENEKQDTPITCNDHITGHLEEWGKAVAPQHQYWFTCV